MNNSYKKFANLRVYKNVSTPRICNILLCNRLMKIPIMVENASRLYKVSSLMFTPYLTDSLMNKTFCRVFTGGNTLDQVVNEAEKFNKEGINTIIDYCAEGDIKEGDNQVVNDENASLFAISASTFSQYPNQIVSIKITGLIKMDLLKRANDAIRATHQFFEQHSVDGKLRGPQAFKGLQKIYDGISDEQFAQYLKVIHNYDGDARQFETDEIGFKMNQHPFYLYEEQKNNNFVSRLFFPLNKEEFRAFHNLKKRIDLICETAAHNTNNFRILVDAEQSYVQMAIEFFTQQMQARYNRNKIYIIPTIQNYLKRSVSISKYEIQIAKRRNLYFGAKLVRGAYLVQETKLAKENNIESPIVSSFEETTHNYLESFRLMASSDFQQGELFVASHNENTLLETLNIHQEVNSKLKINFGQLMGLADHLTYKMKNDGYSVYKLLPWAQTKTMIPYMIRRAEQLSQMKYPLDDQYKLLQHELKSRYIY